MAVSVVVVSRGRPAALRLCLTALGQLCYKNFEIIVVADAGGCAVVADMGWDARVKTVLFEEPNISQARNHGIAASGGEVIAFIDDDAVAEPTWLTYLCAPFEAQRVAASGGFVLGRNGISYQWKSRIALSDGTAIENNVDPQNATLIQGEIGRAVKTEGTNMAFRKSTLVALGGFDAAFAFYLDETDLNMRLAANGATTAIVPRALVHHGFAESARRTVARVPRDLTEIGASLVVYLRKHTDPQLHKMFIRAERKRQRARLLRHMVAGRLEPRDIRKIMRSFDLGVQRGGQRDLAQMMEAVSASGFLRFEPLPDAPVTILRGPIWARSRLYETAQAAVAKGQRVSVYIFDLSIRFHRVRFDAQGFWLQTGGQFGKSVRNERMFQFWRRSARVSHEVERVIAVRDPNSIGIGVLKKHSS